MDTTNKFQEVLTKALNDKSLPKFKYENGVFIIQRISNAKWQKYKKDKKKEWINLYNNLTLKDFEEVFPSSTYLSVEIGYDTPHYKIMLYFYHNFIDFISNNSFNYRYEDKI